MTITPAVLASSLEEVTHNLFLVEGLTEWVQIDVCDGRLGLEKTWLPQEGDHLPDGFSYEFDLMVKDWRKYAPRVIALGAKRIVFHIDDWSEDDIAEMIALVRKHFIYVGFACANDTSIEDFVYMVHFAETLYPKVFIQAMGIKRRGAQGQPFDKRVLRRISHLHDECRNIDIQVDGSMNNETIFFVQERGARCAIVGSYIFGHGATHATVKKSLEALQRSFR